MALTMAQASSIVVAALEHAARANDQPVAIMVADGAGHISSAQRQDGASMYRMDCAGGQAWTGSR